MSADYRSLRWLDRRIWTALAKRAVRSPIFWVFVGYAMVIALVVIFISRTLGTSSAETPTGALPVATWVTLAAVLFVAYLALLAGVGTANSSPEYAGIVLPQPFSLRTLLRWRLVKTSLWATVGWALALTLIGYGFGASTGLPPGEVIPRLILALLPYPLFWTILGMVLMTRVLPRYPSAADYVIGSVSVLVLGTLAIGLVLGGSGLGKLFSDPLIAAMYSLSTPIAESALNLPVGFFGTAVIAFGWASTAAVLPFAFSSELRLPEAYRGATTPPANQLSIERPSEKTWFTRLRTVVRRPYQDRGAGARALEGLAMTAVWRSSLGPMWVGMACSFLLFFGAVTALGPPSAGPGPSFFLGFAVFLGVVFLPAIRGAWWSGAVSVARQSPFQDVAIARALLRPGFEYTVAIASSLGLAAGLASRDPVLGIAEAALFISLFSVEGVLGLFSARSYGYPAEGALRGVRVGGIVPFFGFVLLILAETVFVLTFPHLPPVPNLVVPVAICTAANVLVAAVAMPSAARVLTSPAL